MPVSRAARRRIKTQINKAIVDAIQKNGKRIFDHSQQHGSGGLGIPYDTGQLKSTGQFQPKKDGWKLKYGGNSGGNNGKGAPYAIRLHEGNSGEPIQVQPYTRIKFVPRTPGGAKKRGQKKLKRTTQKVAGYTTTPKRQRARPWVSKAVDTKVTFLLNDLFAALQKQFRARGGSIKGGK